MPGHAVRAFIRRFSLDELPQLSMCCQARSAMVGRGRMPIAVMQYRKLIPGYMIAQDQTGITGWAQVNGYRGVMILNQCASGRVRHGLLAALGLALDLSIILRTAAIVWRDKKAY